MTQGSGFRVQGSGLCAFAPPGSRKLSELRANSVSAIDRARELYRMKLKGKTLEDDIAAYRKIPAGWVIEHPEAFLMARVVDLSTPQPASARLRRGRPLNSSTSARLAWMVDVAVGELRELVRLMPFPLPFIAWHRDGEERLRVYRTDRFLALAEVAP